MKDAPCTLLPPLPPTGAAYPMQGDIWTVELQLPATHK